MQLCMQRKTPPPPLADIVCVSVCAAHQEALRKEIERLRQIYQQQSLKSGREADAAPSVRDDKDMIGSEGTAAPGPPS